MDKGPVLALFEYPVTIRPENIDINGHVNNVNYITWMQHAAVAHSAANGFGLKEYSQMQRSWVVSSHFIEYLRPIFEGDEIIIKTWVDRYGSTDAFRRFHFLKGEKIVAKAETRWVFIDAASGRPAEIPIEIRTRFLATTID